MDAEAKAWMRRGTKAAFQPTAEQYQQYRQHLRTIDELTRYFGVDIKGSMSLVVIINRENVDLLSIASVLDIEGLMLCKGLHSAGEMALFLTKGAMAFGPSSVASWEGTEGLAPLMITFV